ncbi:hypothetical protein BT69DRAFT_1277990 [Atractiella rhizophila]|nr:hypothetical protein BT69DRAFT_1277990 [Atractiella rhizophila]
MSTSSRSPSPLLPAFGSDSEGEQNRTSLESTSLAADRRLETLHMSTLPGWEHLKPYSPLTLTLDPLPGCGGHLWPSSLVLTRYLSRPESLSSLSKHTHCLELGAGTGAVGLGLGRMWEGKIVISDVGSMVELMDRNVRDNYGDGQDRIQARELFWGDPLPSWVLSSKPTLILLSDCIYLETLFSPLISTLSSLWKLCGGMEGKVEVLMASKKRRKADKRFWTLFKKEGWQWEEIEVEGGEEKEGARLFRCFMA